MGLTRQRTALYAGCVLGLFLFGVAFAVRHERDSQRITIHFRKEGKTRLAVFNILDRAFYRTVKFGPLIMTIRRDNVPVVKALKDGTWHVEPTLFQGGWEGQPWVSFRPPSGTWKLEVPVTRMICVTVGKRDIAPDCLTKLLVVESQIFTNAWHAR